MGTRTHEAKVVTVGDRSAEIDLEMVEVIEALWSMDIDTLFSCQGSCGPAHDPRPEPWGYILFPDVEGLRSFLLCFDGTPLSSRRFAQRHEWNPAAGTRTPVGPPSWELRGMVKPPDEDHEMLEPGAPGFRLQGLARFPQADLPEITRIVCARARAERSNAE